MHYPAGQGLPRGRHPRHLRQAADDQPRRGARSSPTLVEKAGTRLRADPQLHRLSDGPAGARDGRRRRARRDPRRAGRISAGLADRADRGRPARSRPPGAPIRRSRAPAARSATSAPTPTISRASSPGSNSTSSRPTSTPSCRAARSTTMRNVMLRFAAAARKGMLWASQVAPGNENGLQAARLRHQGRPRMGAGGSELSLVHAVRRAAAADHPRRRRRRPGCGARHAACRRAIRKAISKASPTSTPRPPRAIRAARKKGGKPPKDVIYPTVEDGVEGRGLRRGLRAVVEEERRLDQAVGLAGGASFEARPSSSHLRMKLGGAILSDPEVRASRALKQGCGGPARLTPAGRHSYFTEPVLRSLNPGWMIPPSRCRVRDRG